MRTYDTRPVNRSRSVTRIAIGAVIGAVAGLLAGLGLLLFGDTDNPVLAAIAGLVVGAVVTAVWDIVFLARRS